MRATDRAYTSMRTLVLSIVLLASSVAVAEPTVDELSLDAGVACAGCTRLAHEKVKGLGQVVVRLDERDHELRVVVRVGKLGAVVFSDAHDGHAGSYEAPVGVTAKLRKLKGAVGVTLTEQMVHGSDDGSGHRSETPFTRTILVACDATSCRRVSVGGYYDDCHDARWSDDGYPEVEYTCDRRASLSP